MADAARTAVSSHATFSIRSAQKTQVAAIKP
jgi:hypothetical protein